MTASSAYGERSRMIELLTPKGLETFSAKLSQKAMSPYSAATQLFCRGEYCLRVSKSGQHLESAKLYDQFYGLRKDFDALTLASYFTQLIKLVATDQPHEELYQLFVKCLSHLEKSDREPLQIKAVFELRAAALCGFRPDFLCCARCKEFSPEGGAARISQGDFLCRSCAGEALPDSVYLTASALRAARHILFSESENVTAFKLKGESLRVLAEYTERYLCYHLGAKFPVLDYFHKTSALSPKEKPPEAE